MSAKCVRNLGRTNGRVSTKRPKEYCNSFSLRQGGKARFFYKWGQMNNYGESSILVIVITKVAPAFFYFCWLKTIISNVIVWTKILSLFVNYTTHTVQVTWASCCKYDPKNQLSELNNTFCLTHFITWYSLLNTLTRCILEKKCTLFLFWYQPGLILEQIICIDIRANVSRRKQNRSRYFSEVSRYSRHTRKLESSFLSSTKTPQKHLHLHVDQSPSRHMGSTPRKSESQALHKNCVVSIALDFKLAFDIMKLLHPVRPKQRV